MNKFLLACLLLSLAAGPAFAAAEPPVKIGVMGPLTGQWASEGQDMEAIVKSLAEQFNATTRGRQVEILVGDDAGDPRTAALAAQSLVAGGAVAVIGTYGSAITEASQDIYAEENVLQIATGSTSIRLTEKGLPLFFRTCPRDDEQGRVLAANVGRLGFKKAAIVHDNSSYAKGLAEEVKPLLAERKIAVVFDDAITPGDRDYNATLTKIKTTGPDVIIFTGYYPEAGLLLRQKHDMSWPVAMIGGDATNNSALVDIAGRESASGYYFISPPGPGDLKSAKSRAFLKTYQDKNGGPPSSVWSIMAGDAFGVLAQALEAGVEATGPALAGYLHQTLKDYDGFTGTISFNEKGDRIGDVYRLYRVERNGGFVLQ
ncbi:MAG: branched-chain amino acid ABC transporter substrate-binding protein [Candidatus Adiutrix sp.]|jgi:branched-chain amino acid transport system substrate-binding protein|nr:branched-chain amino acid ABC transporter substrate-binding protein [Candidatus Adiutrix sp.]